VEKGLQAVQTFQEERKNEKRIKVKKL